MGNSPEQSYYMNVNIIGESMYLFYLYLTRNIYTDTISSDKKEKKIITDYWDFHYNFNQPVEDQIEEVLNRCKNYKQKNDLNSKEILIVHVPNKKCELIDYIFSEMENQLEKAYFMPMILFLCDKNEIQNESNEDSTKVDDDYKIIPDSNKYPNINKNTIYTEYYINDKEYIFRSNDNELTEEGHNKMEKILKVLNRFCSYLNELGDRFSIGEKDQKINYDLCEICFPFTINICCIGRFGKGKSTCVNFILDEEKAKESNSGASTTKNINYYQISNQPIKIYDIPGFESEESVEKTIQKLKELNDEMNELKDNIHIILYMLDSNDCRMFQEMEYNMLKYISDNNSKLCYVLTHSTRNTNKKLKIEMINNGLKSVIDKKKEKGNDFFYRIKANDNNTILVNFHPFDNNPIYGLKQLLLKIVEFSKKNKSYNKLNKNNYTKENYEKKIIEEAELRKKKAEDIIFRHSIGSAIVGIIPFVDIIVQDCVIKKQAAKKIGQIFGINIDLINESKHIGEKATGYLNNLTGMGLNAASKSPTIIKEIRPIIGRLGAKTLQSFSSIFIFVGAASGTGLGYYFMKSDIEKMIKEFYEYFIEHAEEFSDSFEQAIQYLIERANKYDD